MTEHVLQLTADQREILSNTPDFPFMPVEASASDYRAVPWHWHPELEISHICNAGVVFHTPKRSLRAPRDSIVFVNSEVSHSVTLADVAQPTRFRTNLFGREFIAPTGSLLDARYCAPILQCEEMDLVVFAPDHPANPAMLELHEAARRFIEQGGFLSEMRTRDVMSQLWQLFAAETRSTWEDAPRRNDARGLRIRQMLSFVQEHCAEKLALSDIAASANISERECLRCFQTLLNTTPFEYVTDCRMRRAARMLTDTSASITEIAMDCGYASASYFCRTFRRVMGSTPSEYKRLHG